MSFGWLASRRRSPRDSPSPGTYLESLSTVGAGFEPKPSYYKVAKKSGILLVAPHARLRRKDAARTLVKAPHLCDANESRDREPARVGQRRRPHRRPPAVSGEATVTSADAA